jgi:phosphoribosylformimino-5-aminoimidazole carboxamide ribotide isomerase
MLIIPAIDIMDGQCVRLFQGDYKRMTVYPQSPPEMAELFQEQGVEMIHLVDLEGAREGVPANLPTIQKIREAVNISLEVGGGFRTHRDVQRALDLGVERVVIGSVAAEDPERLGQWIHQFSPQRLAVGVDTRGGKVQTRGWLRDVGINALTFFDTLENLGVRTVIYTDVERDGTLSSPNFQAYEDVTLSFPEMEIIASGGISSIEDVEHLRATRVSGVIIGRAIYEGKIDLQDLIGK